MLKSKKGFTLVELSIVIAITSILLVTSGMTLQFFEKQTNTIKKNSQVAMEINQMKEMTEKWISYYDSLTYNHDTKGTTTADYITVNAENTSLLQANGGNDLLQFCEENGVKKLKRMSGTTPISEISVETIENCVFQKENGMISCTVSYGDKSIKLMFNIFSSNSRVRFSDNVQN